MQRSADASAPAVPTGLRLSGNTLTWDASGDPYVAPTGASGLKEYVISRDGVTLATVPTTPGLSPEMTGQDIGAVSPPGTDSQSGASHNMRAAGTRIYFAADEFRFKYATVTGDCTIIARVTQFTASALGFAKASLMFRASTATDAACAHLLQYSNTTVIGTKVEYRPTTAAQMLDGMSVPAGTLPQWLKMTRVGNVFTGFYSYDGNNWQDNGSVSLVLPATVLVGLALCSEVPGTPVDATFTDVVVTNTPSLAYVDSTQVGTPIYRVAARDVAGNTSAFSAPAASASSGGTSEIPAFDTRTPTKYVASSGNYLGNPAFFTLQAAFDAAVPGDVIAIAPGTYSERAVLQRDPAITQNIYVKPADYNNRPLFDGQYSTLVVPGWNAPFNAGRTQLLSIMASGVTVDGLNFIRSPQGGILVGPADNNANFIRADQVGTFYTGNKIIRCSVVGSETAFRTINVDGLDVIGCTFLDCQRAYFRADGFPEDNPTWGSAVTLMGKRINFIENTVGQSSGEGVHLGVHIRFGADAPNAFIQCEDVVVRNCRLFDCWSAPLYISNVDRGVVERNVVYQTGDTRYWQFAANGYPKYCIDIASESGDPGVGGWPPPNGFIGARDLIIRNNIVTGALFGMRFTDWPSQNTTRVKVLNNTFYRSVGGTASFEASLIANEESSLSDITFQNNLVYDAVPAQMCRTWLTPGGTWTRSNNLFSTTPPAALAGSGDVITSSPGLVDPNYNPGGTYPSVVPFDTNAIRLQNNSPAIGAGVVLVDVTNDFFGNPRPANRNDIGAHSSPV